MLNKLQNWAFSIVIAGFSSAVMAQSNFLWQNSTIGGGGFCLEIRFAPPGFLGLPNDQSLYLATDVSGVYRSLDMDVDGEIFNWTRLTSAGIPAEKDELTLYTTTIAFTTKFNGTEGVSRVIAGSQEGIFLWDDGIHKWTAAETMPDRYSLPGGSTMDTRDGRYPWIGIIREYPPNTRFLCAGIGDIRNSTNDNPKFGLGAVLRSLSGGNDWELVKIDGAASNEVVYDIDYVMRNSGAGYTFITTNGGIYYSANMFDGAISGACVSFKNISKRSATDSLENLRGLVVLGNSSAMVTSNPLVLIASLNSLDIAAGGIYDAVTTIKELNSGVYLSWQKMAAEDTFAYKNLGKVAAKVGSKISQYEIFVGKSNTPFLAAATNNDQVWRKIYTSPEANNSDNGYRADKSQLIFGSFDFNPEDTKSHPDVYGCWMYGPFIAKGNSVSHTLMRNVEQMFTTDSSEVIIGPDGDKYYNSRGMDEIYSNGGMVTFHPTNSSILMIGCTDNAILRSLDRGSTWSHRRLRKKDLWEGDYGVPNQTVYHIAYHPLDLNTVLASAGPDNASGVGRGELLKNTNGGAGNESSWTTIAGGPSGMSGLPDGEIQGLVFDARPPKEGVFVVVRQKGIFYGKIMSNGDVDPNDQFQQIMDSDLNAQIPYGIGAHHNYSRIMFDATDAPNNYDDLYVARHGASGGVFRIRLGVDANGNRLPFSSSDFITKVDEVIKGRFQGSSPNGRPYSPNHAGEVISLLITRNHVFAGATPRRFGSTSDPKDYPGGLIRWTKIADPTSAESNVWVIGGPRNEPPAFGNPSPYISIGGLAHYITGPFSSYIYAMTYRFTLREDNSVDPANPKLQGESNYKIMNLWLSYDDGATFGRLNGGGMDFPNAQTMAFNPHDPRELVVPTHGNGIWIGELNFNNSAPIAEPNSTTTDPNLPKRFALHQNYPNPFNPTTVIKYDLPKAAHVTITIYDFLGRRARNLVDEEQKAAYHAKVWDGKNDNGLPAASGIYFYRLQTADFIKIRKMILLR